MYTTKLTNPVSHTVHREGPKPTLDPSKIQKKTQIRKKKIGCDV